MKSLNSIARLWPGRSVSSAHQRPAAANGAPTGTPQIDWPKRVLRRLAEAVAGHYRVNRIFRHTRELPFAVPPDVRLERVEDPPSQAVDDKLLVRFNYAGDDADGFGLFVEGRLAGLCWFWGPRRFDDPLLWVLRAREAICVDLTIAPIYRGRGFATLLIQYAAAELRRAGVRDLYTWMWYSHRASSRAFEKAGWSQVAWVAEVQPRGLGRPLRLCWPVDRSCTARLLLCGGAASKALPAG